MTLPIPFLDQHIDCMESGHDWDHLANNYYEDRETEDLVCRHCGLVWPEAGAYYYTEEEMSQ